MLTREQKKQVVEGLALELKNARGVVFCDFQGLSSKDLQELRAGLRKENVKYKAVKLTLLKRVLREIGVDASKFNFQVPMAVSFSLEDEVAPAKLLQAFAKKHENLKVLAGVLDQKWIDGAEVRKLGSLPSKLELRGQLVATIAGPLRGLVSVLSGNIRGLLNVLKAVKESKA